MKKVVLATAGLLGLLGCSRGLPSNFNIRIEPSGNYSARVVAEPEGIVKSKDLSNIDYVIYFDADGMGTDSLSGYVWGINNSADFDTLMSKISRGDNPVFNQYTYQPPEMLYVTIMTDPENKLREKNRQDNKLGIEIPSSYLSQIEQRRVVK